MGFRFPLNAMTSREGHPSRLNNTRPSTLRKDSRKYVQPHLGTLSCCQMSPEFFPYFLSTASSDFFSRWFQSRFWRLPTVSYGFGDCSGQCRWVSQDACQGVFCFRVLSCNTSLNFEKEWGKKNATQANFSYSL